MPAIRNEKQLGWLLQQRELYATLVTETRERADGPDDLRLTQLDDWLDKIREFDALIEEFRRAADNRSVPVVPLWQIQTGSCQIPHALRWLRMARKLTQSQLAARLKTTQGSIARWENTEDANYETGTLERWAESCGYEFLGFFVETSRGYNDPASVRRLGLEISAMRYHCRDDWRSALRAFLSRLLRAINADALACYLLDPGTNRLVLVHHIGVRDEQAMGGIVKRTNASMRLLHADAGFVADAAKSEIFCSSSFSKREGIRSIIHLPLRSGDLSGILFLNFRAAVEPPGALFWNELCELPNMMAFLLAGARDVSLDSAATLVCEASQAPCALIQPLLHVLLSGGDVDANRRLLKEAVRQLNVKDVYCTLHWAEDGQLLLCEGYPYRPTGGSRQTVHPEQGIIAEAFRSGNPVLADLRIPRWRDMHKQLPLEGELPTMHSELAVPLVNSEGFTMGVINVESPESNCFDRKHARILCAIGQAIVTARSASHLLPQFGQEQLARPVTRLFEVLQPGSGADVRAQLRALAELAIVAFGAAIVDIWPFDWERRCFAIDDGAHAIAKKHERKAASVSFKPREYGNSRRIIEDESRRPLLIPNANEDDSINPNTLRLEVIRSLAGFPFYGPESARSEGVFWLRFDRLIDFGREEDLVRQIRVFADFAHLVWALTPCARTAEFADALGSCQRAAETGHSNPPAGGRF